MKKYVLFDFDGVILDSENLWQELLFQEIKSQIPDWTPEKQAATKGAGMAGEYEILTKKFGYSLGFDEHEKSYRAVEKKVYEISIPVAGVEKLLKNLEKLGISSVIVSSTGRKMIDQSLEKTGLSKYFTRIFTVPETGVAPKPSGEIYELAVRELGAKKSDCVVVEDSRNGVLAGKNAGLFVVGFRAADSDQDLSAADVIVAEIGDVEKYL